MPQGRKRGTVSQTFFSSCLGGRWYSPWVIVGSVTETPKLERTTPVGNLDHVLNGLAAGDEIRADFSHPSGAFNVAGLVNFDRGMIRETVKVGNVVIGSRLIAGEILPDPYRPVPALGSIAIIKRATRPWFKNAPAERVPLKGDIIATVYGHLFYFDGIHFRSVSYHNGVPRIYTLSEFNGERGTATLSSEAVKEAA